MKRTILLFSGLLSLALGFPVLAAGDQYADLEPVSETYVKKVVERAQAGLDYAKQGGGSGMSEILKLFWMDQATSAALALIDTDLRLVHQEYDLLQNTVCLHHDLLILEGWIERMRLEKNNAIEGGQVVTVYRLISLQFYLNDRYRALLKGARDPSYRDQDEGSLLPFDPPSYWCCGGKNTTTGGEQETDRGGDCRSVGGAEDAYTCIAEHGALSKRLSGCIAAGCTGDATAEDAKPLCPFDSDYLPPTTGGYGCDGSVREKVKNGPEAAKKESEGLDKLVESRDAFIEEMGSLKEVIQFLNQYLNEPMPDLSNFQKGRSSEIQHKKKSGCLEEEEAWPQGMALWEQHGPFTMQKNEILLIPKLFDLWRNWGERRVAPDYLKTANEFTEDSDQKTIAEEREQSIFGGLFLMGSMHGRRYLTDTSVKQMEDDSTMVAKALDASQQIMEVLAPLRPEVRTFVRSVASPSAGIRGFVRNYAFFLRHSCIYRPCTTELDRILKIVFQNSCFPYADGQYLKDPKIHEKCKRDAQL